MTSAFDFPEKPLVDSTGIYFTPNLRHLDRGSLEARQRPLPQLRIRVRRHRRRRSLPARNDRRHLDRRRVFRRRFLRLPRRRRRRLARAADGLEMPVCALRARAITCATLCPATAALLPAEINMHSVKNRFLLRMKNMTWDLYRRNFFSITARDIVVVGCCLLWEHTSLKAFPFLFRNWKSVMAKRREIMMRQRVDDAYMASWFSFTPVSKPAPKKFAAAVDPLESAARPLTLSAVRIAILGTRGIPANYGGFETFAEELSIRLVARGHRSLSTAATHTSSAEYRGVHLVYLPTIRHKYFDTLAHTFLSTLHLLCAPRGRRALLQCRQRDVHDPAAPHRYPRRAERGWHRAQDAANGMRSRKAWYRASEYLSTDPAEPVRHRRRSHPHLLSGAISRGLVFIPYGADITRACDEERAGCAWVSSRQILPLCEPHGARKPRARSAPGFREGHSPI